MPSRVQKYKKYYQNDDQQHKAHHYQGKPALSKWNKFKQIVHRCWIIAYLGILAGMILGSTAIVMLLINDLNIPEIVIITLVALLMIVLWKKTA